jgi:hypothetical protein
MLNSYTKRNHVGKSLDMMGLEELFGLDMTLREIKERISELGYNDHPWNSISFKGSQMIIKNKDNVR